MFSIALENGGYVLTCSLQTGFAAITYKAVIQREGEFVSSKHGQINTNEQLAEPMFKVLSKNWEDCFKDKTPDLLHASINTFQFELYENCDKIKPHLDAMQIGEFQIKMLENQLQTYCVQYSTGIKTVLDDIQDGQRTANCLITPCIKENLKPAYATAGKETGKGFFDRMKRHMHDAVQSLGHRMFKEASEAVKEGLMKTVDDIRKDFQKVAKDIMDNLRHDLQRSGALGGDDGLPRPVQTEFRPREKLAIDAVLKGIANEFRVILNLPLEYVSPEGSPLTELPDNLSERDYDMSEVLEEDSEMYGGDCGQGNISRDTNIQDSQESDYSF